jgi:tetratricopeptide (TPR) repeat protein
MLARDERHYEVAWKLARTLCWIARPQRRNKSVGSDEAVEAAKRRWPCVRGSRPAFLSGRGQRVLGDAHGVIDSLFLLDPLRKEMLAVIELDPGFEGGAAHMILGRLDFILPSVLGGGNDKAERRLKTAIGYGPRRWINHLYLAEVYIDEGRKDEARALLRQILDGGPEPGLEPEYREWTDEARYWLKKIRP